MTLIIQKAFKHTDQEVIDFYARSAAIPIPNVPKFDNRRVVDGQRIMTFYKPIPPTSAGKQFELRSKVLGVYDKGKAGTVVETEMILAEKGGDDVYTKAVGSAFFVGQGNWGGPKGRKTPYYFITVSNEYSRPSHCQLPTTNRQETRCSTHTSDY